MNTQRLNTLYECFGLPGGGKTTSSNLANQMLGFPTTADLSIYWRKLPLLKKIVLVLSSLLRETPLWIQLLKFIALNFIIAPRAIIYLIKIPAQKIMVMDFLKTRPLLLDQWQLQNLWSAVLNAKLRHVQNLSPIIAAIYKGINVHIFHFHIETFEAAGRISTRTHGQSRFDIMAHHEISSALGDTHGHLETIEHAAKQLGLPFTDIDGNEPLELNAERIASACKH